MLRIGEVTDTFLPIVDGVGRVVYEYANNLCLKGHEVTVIAPMYDTGFRGGYPFELVDFISYKVPAIGEYQTGEAKGDKHYRKRMKMIPLDIVHTHSPFTAGTEALRLARKRNIPLVGTFHSKYYDDFLKITHSESLANIGTKMVVDFYERCDDVWAVGSQTAGVLQDYGYKGPIHVIPNGVTRRVVDEEALKLVRARYELDEVQNVFLFVGQLNWKKNILRILEACALMKKQGSDFRLLLAGQGPDRDAIRKKIVELDLENEAVLVGHITDTKTLDALYASATLFLFPSLYDNAPMVVREAAAMGTPSILAEGSSASEIIRDGENGWLCRDDSEHLRDVIVRAVSDEEKLKAVSLRAKETIPIPWADIMDMVVDRYTELILRGQKGELKKKHTRIL